MSKTNRTRDKPVKPRTMLPDDWCYLTGSGLLISGAAVWLGLAAALIAAGILTMAAGWLISRNGGGA